LDGDAVKMVLILWTANWPRAEITGDEDGLTVPKRGAASIRVAPIV